MSSAADTRSTSLAQLRAFVDDIDALLAQTSDEATLLATGG